MSSRDMNNNEVKQTSLTAQYSPRLRSRGQVFYFRTRVCHLLGLSCLETWETLLFLSVVLPVVVLTVTTAWLLIALPLFQALAQVVTALYQLMVSADWPSTTSTGASLASSSGGPTSNSTPASSQGTLAATLHPSIRALLATGGHHVKMGL